MTQQQLQSQQQQQSRRQTESIVETVWGAKYGERESGREAVPFIDPRHTLYEGLFTDDASIPQLERKERRMDGEEESLEVTLCSSEKWEEFGIFTNAYTRL